MDWKPQWARRRGWEVDEQATREELESDPDQPLRPPDGGGRVVYIDEDGRRRRLPADLGELTPVQRDAAIAAMSQALGGARPDAARMAAIERLTELHAAGKITEEKFHKERRRLESY